MEMHPFIPTAPQETEDGKQYPVQYRQSQEKHFILHLVAAETMSPNFCMGGFSTHHPPPGKSLCCQKSWLGGKMTQASWEIAICSSGQHWRTLPNTQHPMTAVGFANKICTQHFPDSEKLFIVASIRYWVLPPETVYGVRQTSDLLKSKPLLFDQNPSNQSTYHVCSSLLPAVFHSSEKKIQLLFKYFLRW